MYSPRAFVTALCFLLLHWREIGLNRRVILDEMPGNKLSVKERIRRGPANIINQSMGAALIHEAYTYIGISRIFLFWIKVHANATNTKINSMDNDRKTLSVFGIKDSSVLLKYFEPLLSFDFCVTCIRPGSILFAASLEQFSS